MPSPLLALAWRESRTARRRLALYMSSIALGVAALVAIDSFTDNVTASVREQSRALLGGDVSLSSRQAFPGTVTAIVDSLAGAGYGVADQTTFASMALLPGTGKTRLAQVRAVSAGFPFYGEITTQPAARWGGLQQGRTAIVDPALLTSLGGRVGDELALGAGRFTIVATIDNVPGETGIAAAIGPRIYVADRWLPETGLLVFGSRAEYQTLIKLPATGPNPKQFEQRFEKRMQSDRVRMRTSVENEFNLTRSIEQLRDFLGIVGLVALLLGGIGVASGVHAFVMRKIDTVAILRCLGATSRQVLVIYVAQAALMGLAGAIAGAAIGVGVQFLLPRVMQDFLPVDVSVRLSWPAILLGLGVGVWVALVFALGPLVSLRRISPLQALRREGDAEALRRARRDPMGWLVTGAIVASVVAIAISRAGSPLRGLAFAAGVGGAVLALWVSAATVSWLARRAVRPGWPFTVRQGVAALYRPGNQTRAVALALGFGVFLMSTLYQVHGTLLRQLSLRLDASSANLVFFDVQEDQHAGLDSLIRAQGFAVVQEAPIIPMRIAAINGVPVEQLMRDTTPGRRRAGWAMRREFRSTYRDTLVASETLVAGKWFGGASTGDTSQASIEKDVADELHLKLGDVVTWNVQGVQVPVRITSLREVNWARFEPNFFVVFEPRALQGAPKQFVLLARVPGQEAVSRLQAAVIGQWPSISSVDLTLVQRTVKDVLTKVTMAIRFMAALSLALGIPVLFSAVSATRRERLREGVLLKTLGATRRQIGRILLSEYALLGLLGSITGVALSFAAAWALVRFVFEGTFVPTFAPALLVASAMILLAVAIGMLTGREVFAETPMAALREG